MLIVKPLLICAVAVCAVAFSISFPASAQTPENFTSQRGQVMRITPGGNVDVYTTMKGNPAHIAKMKRRSQPVTKGVVVWVGDDGKVRYLTNPLEDAEHMRR